ncbi:MAG: metalloregulator ArsR/SmtB family transcription factor [Candidatus Omnitrophica bacterium]|jgi:ArsR family transcriptional regulator|nr:metalloregulator ArsR/SmtB family transcription factor [Candidatus Omnitrophota bacterium]MDD5690222.1 metalloregulator ArsR/SmtB family transcription factor [Candidatus Omnitrophota bacterium]
MLNYNEESDFLKALGHPVRLKIVKGLLTKNECNVQMMVKALGLPQSTISQHLGILKSRGILGIRKEGTKSCYRILDKRVRFLLGALYKGRG